MRSSTLLALHALRALSALHATADRPCYFLAERCPPPPLTFYTHQPAPLMKEGVSTAASFSSLKPARRTHTSDSA